MPPSEGPQPDGERPLHPDSLAVGHGYDPASAWGAAKPPIVLTSTYVYPSAQAAKDLHAVFFDGAEGTGEPAYIYSRLGHPNLSMVEARMAALDRAQDCAGFNSGMATISTLAWALLRPGDSVVYSRPIYSGSDNLLNTVLPGFGVAVEGVVDGCDEAAIRAAAEAALARGPLPLFMLESPANPTASIVDIALVRRIADEIGERTGRRPLISVDNTFLGPLLQNPLEHGADLTVTALTKYCGGHSDLLAGSVSGSAELVGKLKALRTVVFGDKEVAAFKEGGFDRLFAAAHRHHLPVFVTCPRAVPYLGPYARRYPDLQFVIDHCGVAFDAPRGRAPIDDAVAMAKCGNVALKWAHAPSFLSNESYPFPDLEPQLARALDAFGRERMMWASDYTVSRHRASWAEALFTMRHSPVLSDDDKAWILGRTTRSLLNWPGPEKPFSRKPLHPHRLGGAAPKFD